MGIDEQGMNFEKECKNLIFYINRCFVEIAFDILGYPETYMQNMFVNALDF